MLADATGGPKEVLHPRLHTEVLTMADDAIPTNVLDQKRSFGSKNEHLKSDGAMPRCSKLSPELNSRPPKEDVAQTSGNKSQSNTSSSLEHLQVSNEVLRQLQIPLDRQVFSSRTSLSQRSTSPMLPSWGDSPKERHLATDFWVRTKRVSPDGKNALSARTTTRMVEEGHPQTSARSVFGRAGRCRLL